MPKSQFELLEHTADIGLIASGDTLPEAFANAAYGMFSIISDMEAVEEKEYREMAIAEDDAEDLLFEWLNSLLYHFDVDNLLFSRFDISELEISLSGCALKARCYGEKYDPARHRLKTGIKSATYHTLEVDRENNRVRVIFDI